VWADSPRKVAEQCDVLFTSLPEPTDVEGSRGWRQRPARRHRKDAAWFDLSTNSPSVVKKLSAAFAREGRAYAWTLRSAAARGCASGKLAIWVGGEKAAFDRYKPVLDAMGDKAAYIGPIGAATIAKLVHNMSSYAVTCAIAETFALGIKAGVEPLALWNAVRQGAAGRRQTFDVVIDPVSCRTTTTRPPSRSSSRTRTCRSQTSSAASSACRCASAISRSPR
jgi:3-hydroxyisobutyrate dehydrogenase